MFSYKNIIREIRSLAKANGDSEILSFSNDELIEIIKDVFEDDISTLERLDRFEEKATAVTEERLNEGRKIYSEYFAMLKSLPEMDCFEKAYEVFTVSYERCQLTYLDDELIALDAKFTFYDKEGIVVVLDSSTNALNGYVEGIWFFSAFLDYDISDIVDDIIYKSWELIEDNESLPILERSIRTTTVEIVKA